jgi:hypothetical protein
MENSMMTAIIYARPRRDAMHVYVLSPDRRLVSVLCYKCNFYMDQTFLLKKRETFNYTSFHNGDRNNLENMSHLKEKLFLSRLRSDDR